MQKILAVAALFAFTASADPYGRVDPVRTGLMGAAVGGGLGLVGGWIARDQQGRAERHYGYGQAPGYYAPPPGMGRW